MAPSACEESTIDDILWGRSIMGCSRNAPAVSAVGGFVRIGGSGPDSVRARRLGAEPTDAGDLEDLAASIRKAKAAEEAGVDGLRRHLGEGRQGESGP